MQGTRAIAVFCEDIREEKSGQDTLIGILPDNMAASTYPSVVPKLGIYVRAHIDPKSPPKEMVVKLRLPWGESPEIGRADMKLIDAAAKQAIDSGLPLGGIVLKAMMSPFVVQRPGLATLVIVIDGKESVCGMLNLKPTSASASPPPSSQSPPAA